MIRIIHPDNRMLQLDATVHIGIARGGTAASHPIEEGAPAIDHIEPRNPLLTITGKISGTPFEGDQVAAGDLPPMTGLQSVTAGATGNDRVQLAGFFLEECLGVYVTVLSTNMPENGTLWWPRCLLTDFPTEFSIVRSSPFTLQFVIPRVVSVDTATIPRLKKIPAVLHPEEEAGPAGKKKVDKDSDVSLAHRLTTFFGSFK